MINDHMYVFISVAGSGITALAHLDGADVKSGVQQMMRKLKQLSRGAPEGRSSIFCCGNLLLLVLS